MTNDKRHPNTWLWDWSKEHGRAWIMDLQGFTIVGCVLSKRTATILCHEHNRKLEG